MKITKRIYNQTIHALSYGYKFVIISKNKKGFVNNQAKGYHFEIHPLQRIKYLYEEKTHIKNKDLKFDIFHSRGRRLGPYEIVKLNRFNIKFSDMMKLKPKLEHQIPSLIYYSTNLKEALKNNYWFMDIDREPNYIYIDWNNYPGIFTYNNVEKLFTYRDRKNNIIVTKKNIDDLRGIMKCLK